MLRQLTPQEARKYTEDDPVRPHLSTEFRTTQLREMWGLFEDKYAEYDEPRVEPRAVVCVAYTSCVVASEQELAAHPGDQVATFYTVWSYDRGAGRQIVNQLAQHTLNTKPQVREWVTLSPLTDMARIFHTRNGATLRRVADSCQVFDYTGVVLESEQARSA